jgi:hypothetical protein
MKMQIATAKNKILRLVGFLKTNNISMKMMTDNNSKVKLR